MITLNLIPPDKKKDLEKIRYYIMAKNLIVVILLIISLVTIILLLSKLILQDNFTNVVERNTLTTQYARIFNVDLKKFNRNLQLTKKIQSDYIPWTNFMVSFTKLIPNDVQIESLNLNKETLLITGFAKTRDALLRLKENFENSEFFTNVTVPLDNLLNKDRKSVV